VSGTSGRFALGPFPLACGHTIAEAQLSYCTFGELNAERSNAVLYPTSYGAHHGDIAWAVGPVLDPQRHFIVIVDMWGNGLSSSPSHGAMGLAESGWVVSHGDNVRAQRRLLWEQFGIERLALIYGWSMGGQQGYQWAVDVPEAVERLCVVCGTARTAIHNRLFLHSLRQALTADRHWTGTGFEAEPIEGLRTFALIYASWAASQRFYGEGHHLTAGPMAVEDYVETQWLPAYRRHDPCDLIAMIDTWMAHDVSAGAPHHGDLAAALGSIRARTSVLAGRHDLYFTVDDMEADAARIPGAHFEVIDSVLGHRAGNPRNSPAEQAQLRSAVDRLWRGPGLV